MHCIHRRSVMGLGAGGTAMFQGVQWLLPRRGCLHMNLRFHTIDLSRFFNNDGISYDANRLDGDFDGEGNTYPAEDLPDSNALVWVKGVLFLFPDKADGQCNNIYLERQLIELEPVTYSGIHVLGAADCGRHCGGGFVEDVELHYDDGSSELVALRLTDWNCLPGLRFGAQEGIRCSELHTPAGDSVLSDHLYETRPVIWLEQLKVDPGKRLCAIQLPDNPCMHIFAMSFSCVTHARDITDETHYPGHRTI